MADFTLFELHLDDASFSANNPLGGSSDGGRLGVSLSEESEADSGGSGGRGWVGPVIGLLFLVGVALVAKKRMDRQGSESGSGSLVQEKLGQVGTARSD